MRMTTSCLSYGYIPRTVAFACAIAAGGTAIAQSPEVPGDSDPASRTTWVLVEPPGGSAKPSRAEPVALRTLEWDSVARAAQLHRLNATVVERLRREWLIFEEEAVRLRDERDVSRRSETMQHISSLVMRLEPPLPQHALLFPGLDDPESLPKRAPREDPGWEELWRLLNESSVRVREIQKQLQVATFALFDRMTIILEDELADERMVIPAFLSRTAIEHLHQHCHVWIGPAEPTLRPVDIRHLIEDEVIQALLEDDAVIIDAGDGLERSRLQITEELAAIASDFEVELKDVALQAIVHVIPADVPFHQWLDRMYGEPPAQQSGSLAVREWSARHRAAERGRQRIRWILAASLRLTDTELDEMIDGLYAAHFNEYLRHVNWDARFATWLDELRSDDLLEARNHLAARAAAMRAESLRFARQMVDLLGVEGTHQGMRFMSPPGAPVVSARDQRVKLASEHVRTVVGWRDEIGTLLPPELDRDWIGRTEGWIRRTSLAARWW